MYFGESPLRALYVKSSSLKVTRYLTGSQLRDSSTGVIMIELASMSDKPGGRVL